MEEKRRGRRRNSRRTQKTHFDRNQEKPEEDSESHLETGKAEEIELRSNIPRSGNQSHE